MSAVVGLVGFLLFGAVVGYLARLLMPGPDPMGCLGTVALGAAGSLVGGTIGSLLVAGRLELSTAGFLGSLLGALLVLALLRRSRAP